MAGYACFPIIFYRNNTLEVFNTDKPLIRGSDIQERHERLEKTPKRAAALARARQRYAEWSAAEEEGQVTLTTLRLQAGLSQALLANKLGTQQSNISRMESQPGDVTHSMLKRLAAALGVPIDQVSAAIDASNDSAQAREKV